MVEFFNILDEDKRPVSDPKQVDVIESNPSPNIKPIGLETKIQFSDSAEGSNAIQSQTHEERFQTTIESLHTTIKVQKQVTHSIREEIDTHNRLLDNINTRMEDTKQRLKTADKKINKI